MFKKSKLPEFPKLFNNLPLELKSISDFKLFKSKLKIYLLQNVFYSLQEFFVCNKM
jgi:hypothetical protein